MKKVMGEISTRFDGNRQQDSQELLAVLLDALHEDLNRAVGRPLTAPVDRSDFDSDAAAADEAWRRHQLRNKSFVVDQFQAQSVESVEGVKGHL